MFLYTVDNDPLVFFVDRTGLQPTLLSELAPHLVAFAYRVDEVHFGRRLVVGFCKLVPSLKRAVVFVGVHTLPLEFQHIPELLEFVQLMLNLSDEPVFPPELFHLKVSL